MGYLRFLLAFLVMLSHFLSLYGYSYSFNFGVSSVVVFYILAGYVVTKLNTQVFNGNVYLFILDRFLRIYPSYFIASVVCLVFLVLSGFGIQDFSVEKLFLNFLLVPVNFYLFFPDSLNVLLTENVWWPVIPPAWSLAVEFQAYVVMVFLLKNKLLFALAFMLSVVVSIVAKAGFIDPDMWGYRLLPGVLIFFLGGGIVYMYTNRKLQKVEKIFYLSFMFVYVVISLLLLLNGKVFIFTRETLVGFVIGVILVYIILKNKPSFKFDKQMAFLSYPVFLNHFTAIYITKHLFPVADVWFSLLSVVVITLSLSILMAFVDIKLFNIRKNI